MKKNFLCLSPQRTLRVILLALTLSSEAAKPAHPVYPELELLITSPRVVDSPAAHYPGDWSFGTLMERTFGEKLAPSVVRSWLLSYDFTQKIATYDVPAREKARRLLIEPWQKADGFTGSHSLEWRPDFKNAPFQLLAIVNRQDVGIIQPNTSSSSTEYYNTSGSAGELRFVYGVTDQEGQPLLGGMTIILEFRSGFIDFFGKDVASAPERRQMLLHELALEWHHLGRRGQIDKIYLEELAQLTNILTTPLFGERAPTPLGQKPLGDDYIESTCDQPAAFGFSRLQALGVPGTQALLRIRTNDNALGAGREFRQFNIHEWGILPAPVSASPAQDFWDEGSSAHQKLVKYFKQAEPSAAFLPTELEVDGTVVPVLGGHSLVMPHQEDIAWRADRLSAQTRRKISLNSCIGCHGSETNSSGFHIAPRLNYVPSLLSDFLASTDERKTTKDPVSNERYTQKGELARRISIQEELLKKRNIRSNRFAKLRSNQELAPH